MTALPAPVARFREAALRGAPPELETVVIETRAWMRRPRLPRVPLEIRMSHRVGREFVHDIRLGRRPLAVRFGADAYVDGRGLMRIGGSLQVGPAFDQGALIAMWGEVLGFPQAWQDRDDVRWEAVDDATARFVVPGPEGEIPITVAFDPLTGCPTRCLADRHRSTGPRLRWTGTSRDWRRFGGVLAPGRFAAQWADEPAPWIEIEVVDVLVGAPVDAELARARQMLAGAPAGG